MGLVIDFFNKFSSFSILSCYPNSGKDLIYLFFFLSLPFKPNKVQKKRGRSQS